MTDETLEEYVKQYIEAQQVNDVTFAWQGGEPTLMGVDFFRQAVRYQQKIQKVWYADSEYVPDKCHLT